MNGANQSFSSFPFAKGKKTYQKDRNMYTDIQLEHYADIMLWALDASRQKPIARQQTVQLKFDLPGLKLVHAIYKKLVERRINVVVNMNHTAIMEQDFYHIAGPKQLDFIAPGTREVCEDIAGSIHILAPQDLTHLAGVEPAAITARARAYKPYRDILTKRELMGEFSWTLCLYPTPKLAKAAGLSYREYAKEVASSCYLNTEQPLKRWKQTMQGIREIQAKLNSLPVRVLHMQSDQVDLEITPGDNRRWEGLTGHNIPSFELYFSPDWRGTRGIYFADQPSYRSGNLVSGVYLEFVDGQVVTATAQEGEKFLLEQLHTDKGASRLGEFSLTDKRFSPVSRFMAMTLFDENFGGEYGNSHIALGMSYPSTYAGTLGSLTTEKQKKLGFNTSALHWDLVNTEQKTVTAILKDGKKVCIYENGEFIF